MRELDLARLTALSEWIDEAPANVKRDAEARTWGRLAKVAEESGEVISAWMGATEQNPRKGISHTRQDVCNELLDTAVTALAAYEHMTGNRGTVAVAFERHLRWLSQRVGIES